MIVGALRPPAIAATEANFLTGYCGWKAGGENLPPNPHSATPGASAAGQPPCQDRRRTGFKLEERARIAKVQSKGI
jgi:hypothetical protein